MMEISGSHGGWDGGGGGGGGGRLHRSHRALMREVGVNQWGFSTATSSALLGSALLGF